MSRYRHTQFGMVTAFALGLGSLVAAVVLFQTANPIGGAVFGVLFVCLVLFYALTVEIDDEKLRVWFGLGIIRRSFTLAEIRDARPVRNKWYWGWGVKRTPHGWMFNVSGLDAVEITLASGKRFRIGTDEPAELVRAVREAIGAPAEG